jgi:hypothetical protein
MRTRTLAASGLLLTLLAPVAGCKEPTGGAPQVASIAILLDAVRVDERSIAVGDRLQLRAEPRDASDRTVEGKQVTWSSSNAAVASVDASGVVTGQQLGTAWIRATTDRISDSVRVNVSERYSGLPTCAPGQAGLALAVGQAHVASAHDSPVLCIAGGAGTEYVLIPFHASGVAVPLEHAAGARLVVEVAASGITGSLAASPSVATLGVAPWLERSALRSPGERADREFHLRLHERTRRELEPRLRELRAVPGAALEPSFSRAAAVPAVGARLQINVRSDQGCATPSYSTGRVVAVSSRAIVVADTANPAGGFSDAEYAQFGARFDETIWPLATQTFGEPHDMDGNQRVIIFFTRAVNALTQPGSGSYVGGFFFDRDLFPRTGTGACAGSNEGEILYLMVPDAQRGVNERSFRKENVERRTLAVMGHELQHLINASRRLHVNKALVWEEIWLNEGLSHAMEELLFYRVTGLTPRSNLDGTILQDAARRRAFEEYQLDNFERLVQYLANTQSHSIMGGSDLPMRGAAWSFLRYAADRQGGAERDFWFRLVNSRTSGAANLREVLGEDPSTWVQDWTVALFADDFVPGLETRFQLRSWNHRSIVPAARALIGHFNTSYPLSPMMLNAANTQTVRLHSGGAAYFRFAVPAEQQGAVRLTSGGLQAPSKLRVAVMRTR